MFNKKIVIIFVILVAMLGFQKSNGEKNCERLGNTPQQCAILGN